MCLNNNHRNFGAVRASHVEQYCGVHLCESRTLQDHRRAAKGKRPPAGAFR